MVAENIDIETIRTLLAQPFRKDGCVLLSFDTDAEVKAMQDAFEGLIGTPGSTKLRPVLYPLTDTKRIELLIPRAELSRLQKKFMQASVGANRPAENKPPLRSGDSGASAAARSKSVGDFMLPLAGLEPVLDACQRLEHTIGNAGGVAHRRLTTKNLYSIRFRDKDVANWVAEKLYKLLPNDEAFAGGGISIEQIKEPGKRPEYWLYFSTELASHIVAKSDVLYAMRNAVKTTFLEMLDAPEEEKEGLRKQAEARKTELLAECDKLGLRFNSREAAEMTKRVLADTRFAKSR